MKRLENEPRTRFKGSASTGVVSSSEILRRVNIAEGGDPWAVPAEKIPRKKNRGGRPHKKVIELPQGMSDWPVPADFINSVISRSGFSPRRWAEWIGFSNAMMHQVCSGNRRISVEFAVRFAARANIPARTIIQMQADHDLRLYLLKENSLA